MTGTRLPVPNSNHRVRGVRRWPANGVLVRPVTRAEVTAGFTLVEFIIALAILAITLSLAAPAFRTAIRDGRMTTQVNTFIGLLNMARSEAVRRGVPVTLCRSRTIFANLTGNNPRYRCDNTNANRWEEDKFLFVDTTGDGRYSQRNSNLVRAPNEDILLRVYPAQHPEDRTKSDALKRLKIRAVSPASVLMRRSFTYTPDGFARDRNGVAQAGYFVFCDDRGFGPATRAVVIGPTGRPRVVIKRDDDQLPAADREFVRYNITTCTP